MRDFDDEPSSCSIELDLSDDPYDFDLGDEEDSKPTTVELQQSLAFIEQLVSREKSSHTASDSHPKNRDKPTRPSGKAGPACPYLLRTCISHRQKLYTTHMYYNYDYIYVNTYSYYAGFATK